MQISPCGGAAGEAPVPRAPEARDLMLALEDAGHEPGGSTGSGSEGSSDRRTPGDLMRVLRTEHDPATESLDQYRDRMQRALAVCAIRGLAVDTQGVEERSVRADVLASSTAWKHCPRSST